MSKLSLLLMLPLAAGVVGLLGGCGSSSDAMTFRAYNAEEGDYISFSSYDRDSFEGDSGFHHRDAGLYQHDADYYRRDSYHQPPLNTIQYSGDCACQQKAVNYGCTSCVITRVVPQPCEPVSSTVIVPQKTTTLQPVYRVREVWHERKAECP